MNTNLKPETEAFSKLVAFAVSVCFLAIGLLDAVDVGFAQTPDTNSSPTVAPAVSPTPPPKGQTNINSSSTEPTEAEPKLSADELASLVGPIALYPDPLLFQVLAASTYPLEIVQLKQWLGKNKNLEGRELAEAVSRQNWDPSVQALAPFPILVG